MKIISNKHIFLLGLVVLCLSGLSIILNHQGFALKLMIFAFLILILATVQYIREVKHER